MNLKLLQLTLLLYPVTSGRWENPINGRRRQGPNQARFTSLEALRESDHPCRLGAPTGHVRS